MDHQSLSSHPVEIEMHAAGMLEEPYGAKARIGLLVLSTDPVIERDFHTLVPSDDIGVFTTRIYLETPNSDRTLMALQDEIEAAVKLIIPDTRLDSVVFGCTAASTLIGPERIEERVQRGRPGLACTNPATATVAALRRLGARKIALVTPYTKPVSYTHVQRGRPGLACTNPATATVAALRRLGARKIALVTPYTKQMTGNVTKFLTEAGLQLTSARAVGCDTDDAIGSVPASVYMDAVRQSDLAGADAIFISCTVTKALNEIEKIEAETGLPVVVSNQAAFWHALTFAGWKSPIPGYGRLLREMW
ncbi:Asp/Glu/hydantoin racemase [Burkholderia sp. BT03]|nr:Asp/Glu/hydantoin racemase [Burkholderia sp. BT03]